MDKLQLYLIEITKIFGYKYDEFFFDYLKSISIPNTTKCGKEIKEGDGGWKCRDCEFESYSIYCNECFIKEKHIGHKISYNPSACGFCDCGEKSILKPAGFCDNHTGDYDNMNDLMNFIKKNIPEKFINSINEVLNKIFLLFIEKIKGLNKENEDEIFKMIDSFELFCDKLYQNNLGLFYLVSLKFTENFPYETNHKCFYYDENEGSITFIKKDENQKHNCICHFLQVIIYVLMRRKTKQNSSSFFNLFLQTYKNKIVTSLCFFNSFSQLFYNDNLEKLRSMGFQLINEDINLLLYQGNNILFLQELFEEIYSVCNDLLNDKKYEDFYDLIYRFYQIIKFLPSNSMIEKINSNYKLMKIIFDICNLVNNLNTFENQIKFNKFQHEAYIPDLINAESFSLLTIISLTHIIDFNNKEEINFIFNVIFDKLFEFKRYKESLGKKIFSPHLFIIRCYSLFLNRFCFDYSIKNECDLLDSFNHFQQIYPRSKELNIFLYEELVAFFGFIVSQLYSFFAYFGKGMLYYYVNYFNNKFLFIKCDISLMQYLLTLPEIKEKFNLKGILILTDIQTSNELFYILSKEEILTNITKFQVNLRYINSLIEFMYLIIRDSLSMENIAFRDVDFKWKMKDEIYEKLYQNEHDKIHTLIKNEIINFILGNKNLVKRDECINYLEQLFDGNYIELVDEILKNNCEKISLTNGLMKFSLNKDMLKLFDIDYIVNCRFRKNALDYITNFQSKNYNHMNFNILQPLKIKQKLMENVYQTFYNENNLNDLIEFYNFIYSNKEKAPLIKNIYHLNISKILSFSYKLCLNQFFKEDIKVKIIEKLSQIQDKEFFKNIFENTDENNDELKNKKLNLKEKLKQKYSKKSELIYEKFKVNNIIIEDNNQVEEESCVYCREPLLKDPNNLGYYGKICYYFSDYLTDIMRKLPEKERKLRGKFVSCNHKIHNKCFNEYICLHMDNENNDFQCPLCKKLSNIVLFDFGKLIKDNNYNDIIKGINYENDGINIDEFYKEDKDNKYQILINSNILAFESYCSKISGKQILIKDINSNKNLEKQIFDSIVDTFEEFTKYYAITNNKSEQIDIWKNILFNMKILFQYKILNTFDDILKLINLFKFDNINYFEELLTNFNISDVINKFIIFSAIIFEANEENKNKIRLFFERKILLYLTFIAYIKSNRNLDDFLVNNKEELEKSLELYKLKYKICFLIFDEEEENIKINISLEEISTFIKSNTTFINLNQSTKINSIKEQYLQLPELNLVSLPQRGIEFLNRKNANCFYCHKKSYLAYYCLICGKQICNNINCTIIDESNGQKEYALIYHSIKCSGNNGIFLNIHNVQIVYILDRKMINSGIYIYLNNFGEHMKDRYYLNDDYVLNKNELKKAINKYIDLTFRKKIGKIFYLDNQNEQNNNNGNNNNANNNQNGNNNNANDNQNEQNNNNGNNNNANNNQNEQNNTNGQTNTNNEGNNNN